MSQIDWSKAGKRLRYQPSTPGRNPDFNWAAQRWKDEADYYADEIGKPEIVALAACLVCGAPAGQPCADTMFAYHQPRARAAGLALLKERGPRFGGAGFEELNG